MARYGKTAATKVKAAMKERKKGTLKSGRSGKTVRSRKQAIAIGLSQARSSGAKVPKKRATAKKATGTKSAATKKTARKSTTKKATGRKPGRRASPAKKK